MCGIFGFYSNKLSVDDQISILKNMGERLIHRGPDDEGYFFYNRMAMGMRRLRIIDLETGKQPIYSYNKSNVIVFNGEIYNFRELRKDLNEKGYKFRTKSDTEVVVNLYQEKGVESLQDFNGMFAFGIYDKTKDELFIARDRFGIKPLYYYYQNETLIFASEIKALLCYPDVSREISVEALDLYLTFEHVPAPYSIYKNISKLEQGHYLLLKNGKLTKQRYYEVSYGNKHTSRDTTEYIENLDILINRAVKRRTISDVPLGAFLSGGIDSALITYYLVKNSSKKVKTFSVAFEDKSFDESFYSRQVADYLCTDHHEHIFTTDDLIKSLPAIIDNMDEPFADASLLPTALLSRFAHETVTVALSGDGGDEIFAGYPTYYARKLAQYIPKWVYPLIRIGAKILPVNDDNISFDFRVKKFIEGLGIQPDLRHQIWLGSFTPKQKLEILNIDTLNQLEDKTFVSNFLLSHMRSCDTENNWERSLWIDMRFYLQDNMLVKVDRASMMHSLEVRVPYLDHQLVEYAIRIPAKYKYNCSISKYILKKLASAYLPKNIVKRSKKGFGIPIAKWIKHDLKSHFQETLSKDKINTQGFLNGCNVQSLLYEHLLNKKDNRKLLWTLYIFSLWLENN